jgi:hypothetical protein
MERAIKEKKDLRCSCRALRTWQSLPPLESEPSPAPQPLPRPNDGAFILDAKDYIESRLMEGVSCPCCGRNNKRYTRPLDAGIARGLVALVRASPNGEIVHVKDIPEMLVGDIAWTSHDFAKARYWGLCEEVSRVELTEKELKKTGRRRKKGFWRSTETGRMFVYSMLKVSKYVDLLNNNFEKIHGDDWSIQDALGHPFDFYEVTGATRPIG